MDGTGGHHESPVLHVFPLACGNLKEQEWEQESESKTEREKQKNEAMTWK